MYLRRPERFAKKMIRRVIKRRVESADPQPLPDSEAKPVTAPEPDANETPVEKALAEVTQNDLGTMRALAIGLEASSPFEANVLYRLVLKHRPKSSFLLDKVAKLESHPYRNTVVGWRNDGLCERINSIFLGYFAAKAAGLEFKFFWPDTQRLNETFRIQFNNGHSVPERAAELFSEQFLAAHLIDETDLMQPRGGIDGSNPIVKSFFLDDFRKLEQAETITRPCWLAPFRMLPEIEAAFDRQAFREFFRDTLFNQAIRAQFEAIDGLKLNPKRVAIHVRGGDVIYNDARYTHTLARIKTCSLAVADALCKRYVAQGYDILVFGATMSDLQFLVQYNPGVRTVDDLGLGQVDLPTEVIREVWLMSGCEQLISSFNTGVSKLAEMIGHTELLSIPELMPPAEEYRISLDWVASPQFETLHPLQQAFTHYALFITAPEHIAFETLRGHVEDALRCDPDNIQYRILELMLAYILDDPSQAEQIYDQLSSVVDRPISDHFTDVVLRRNYIALGEPQLARLWAALAERTDLPDYLTAFITDAQRNARRLAEKTKAEI